MHPSCSLRHFLCSRGPRLAVATLRLPASHMQLHPILLMKTRFASPLPAQPPTAPQTRPGPSVAKRYENIKATFACTRCPLDCSVRLAQLNVPDLQVVIISRSGRTSEAVRAAELLSRERNLHTLGLTCTSDSDLAKVCQLAVVLPFADENSTVMTRSFTSMLLAVLQ